MPADSQPATLLVDNGSHRAESTLSLRRAASALAEKVGVPVHLGGVPAEIFEPFIKARQEEHGTSSFLVVPLFFGHSAAIFEYLPQRVRELQAGWPELQVRVAPCLVDLDDPTDLAVARILARLVRKKTAEADLDRPAVTLVEHGTPRIAVNKVRNHLAAQLREELGADASAVEASSMERRDGDEYAFNEPLLETLLGKEGFDRDVVLSMLFLSPGRHAGPGGDIAGICSDAEKAHPGLRTHMSELFATDPAAIELLAQRYRQGLGSVPVSGEVEPPRAARQPDPQSP
jgi:sirohydrochlorin ferrochelatase